MRVREYRAGDIELVRMGEQERAEMEVLAEEVRAALDDHDGPVWSLVDGESVLGIWGTRLINGDGHTWALLSEDARQRPVSLHKAAVRCMRESEAVAGRIFGLVLESAEKSHRWAVRLGFMEIGTVEYGGILYRRYLWRSAQS